MFAVQAEGRTIRTVEGLATDGVLHPLQQAFCEHHGAAVRLLHARLPDAGGRRARGRIPTIDEEELRDVLSSNLCRCTGYQNILKAVRAAAEKMR